MGPFANRGSERVPGYRLQFLNKHGEPTRGIDLECNDDAHAIMVVEEHLIHDRMELWQGQRLVKRFDGA